MASGVPGLDAVLHGGLIAGRLYLVDGEPGAGKTTLAMQYLMQSSLRYSRQIQIGRAHV